MPGAKSELSAPGIIGSRWTLTFALPLKTTLNQTYVAYIKANDKEKADIWAARDVQLPKGKRYATVKIVVWDSGVDAPIFKGFSAFAEYKLSYARVNADLEGGGTLEVNPWTNHFVIGISYRFF